MRVEKNYNLSELNTFGVNVNAKFFVSVKEEEDLQELFNLPEFKHNEKIFLGGGSNVLFTKNFDGFVVLNQLKGIKIVEEDMSSVVVQAMGGENWRDLVAFAVSRGYWGIENLALVPGTAGAAPMQNIGAYGAELGDTLLRVEAYEVATGEKKIFSKEECELGYRDSVFKNRLKGKYFISAVALRLSKEEKKNTSYKILGDYLREHKIEVKSPRDVSEAVSAIRRSKLPDPKEVGNAGSFFKNVFVEKNKLEQLRQQYPEMPSFEENGLIKIPAGWLIEQCGPHLDETGHRPSGASWRGYREGNIGVHEKQALILVNYGGASGLEILNLAKKIKQSVYKKFGLDLLTEVNIV